MCGETTGVSMLLDADICCVTVGLGLSNTSAINICPLREARGTNNTTNSMRHVFIQYQYNQCIISLYSLVYNQTDVQLKF